MPLSRNTDRVHITGRIRGSLYRCSPHATVLHNLQQDGLSPANSLPPRFPHTREGMDAKPPTLSLGMVPQEVLEHIAFFAATDGFLGPPAGIVPLLTLNRSMHDALSFQNNPHLYARIFSEKFDDEAPLRRLGVAKLPPTALAEELRRRSVILKRIRAQTDTKSPPDEKHIRQVLWTAYLMVLENDGRNERQLLEFAHMNDWLKEYLFELTGASDVLKAFNGADTWARNSERMSLALWLFWYLLEPGKC